MSQQITIVWDLTSRFNSEGLKQILKTFKAKQNKATSEYEEGFWKVDGLTVKLYKKKLLVQGNLNDYNKNLFSELQLIDGMTLDSTNAAKLRQIFPSSQNAIICDKCRNYSLEIEGTIEGLDVVFKKECGHADKLTAPLTMTNSRVLPDINILISKSLSRLVSLGYFKGFEVVIPEFILDVIDEFKGKGNKEAVSKELKTLRSLEKKELIKIVRIEDNIIKFEITNLGKEEDKIILTLAQLTNSVLLTGDQVLRTRALIKKRPTIYIPAEVFAKIKIIEEIRNP